MRKLLFILSFTLLCWPVLEHFFIHWTFQIIYIYIILLIHYISLYTRIHPSIMTFEFYIILKNGDDLTFSLFLSLSCCCQYRFKRYIAKQTNLKTEETVPLWHQLAFPTTCLLSFPFFFDLASPRSHDSFFLSFTFSSQPAVMTTDLTSGLFSFLFSFNVASQKPHNSFFLSLSL